MIIVILWYPHTCLVISWRVFGFVFCCVSWPKWDKDWLIISSIINEFKNGGSRLYSNYLKIYMKVGKYNMLIIVQILAITTSALFSEEHL